MLLSKIYFNKKRFYFGFRGFSHLPENQYENVLEQCTKRLEEFLNKQGKEHRIEYISMLNYLIENFPFGNFSCSRFYF